MLSISKLAALVALGGLSIGLVGQGLRAQFTDSATVAQTISIGTMKIQVYDASDTLVRTGPSAATLRCASVPVTTSTGNGKDTCAFSIGSTGSIPATSVSVVATYASTGSPEWSDFWLKLNQPVTMGASPSTTEIYSKHLSDSNANGDTVYSVTLTSTPLTFDPYLDWAGLTNTSENSSIAVTYTIQVTA